MPPSRVAPILAVLLTAVLGLSSCLVRRRVVSQNGKKTGQRLLVADKTTLIGVVERHYNAVRDLSATVDMTPALGSAEKSRITEYKEVRGFILFHKPDVIRIIGLYPVVRNKAFDMVSTGPDFQLYIPSRNRFITGKNAIVQPSQNKIENLRPEHFLQALLVRPPEENAKLLIQNFTDENDAFYILYTVHSNPDGQLQLQRAIWFSRVDLSIARQLIYDPAGNILTDARYSEWRPYDNIPFPKHIEINRPRDEYAVVIDVVKMDINKGVAADKFVLERPEGTTLQVVGQGAPPPETAAPASPSKGTTRKK